MIFHSENDFVMDGKNMKPVKKALKNLSTAIGESKLFNHIYLYKPDIIKVKFVLSLVLMLCNLVS